MSGKLTVALAEVPSPKLAVSVKPAPLPNSVGFRSDANTKNAPPSATPKLTVPVPVLSSAPSRLPAAPSAQCAVAGSVSQTPPPAARRSSSPVSARAPLPAWMVTRKLPSSATSALQAPLPCPSTPRPTGPNRPGFRSRPAVGDADAHRPGPGVEQGAVETGRGPQGPVRRREIGVPDPAAGPQLEPCHCPGETPRLDGHPEGAIERAVRAEGRVALPHPVPQLAEKRQAECRRWRRHREAARQPHCPANAIRHRHVRRAQRRRGLDR